MSDATLADYRASLEEERDQLAGQLEQMGEGETFDQNFADSSQVTAERAEVEAMVNSIKDTLAEVEHALDKFESGSYGICENCGQPIAAARLEAKPAARFCITCASSRR